MAPYEFIKNLFGRAKQKVAPEQKELYDHTEKIQFRKGQIIVILNDGNAVYEDILEIKRVIEFDAYYSDYYKEWRQGSPGVIKSLEDLLSEKIQNDFQGQNFALFKGEYLSIPSIKLVKLTNVQPWKTETITYKKYRE